ncbi:MAG: hypothetical protein JJW00_06985 [Sulfurimonas sp.]|nr:hypothetical protein [Sulfurimonas sp.]
MNKKIDKILEIWHKRFSDEKHQYTEYESSDIEYFISCLLYNHFNLLNALDTMKTIDLSYDFIRECGDEYDEVISTIKTIEFDDEMQKLDFLLEFLLQSQKKYNDDENYLLKRMNYHVDGIKERYINKTELQKVVFEKPKPRSSNPLLR